MPARRFALSPRETRRVPQLDLSRQYAQIREEVLAAIQRVCDSQQYILGPEVEALEREIAAFTGAAHSVACASGTDGLWLALASSGVQPGDSVVTTPFSFFATVGCIVRAGARPVLVDIDRETFNLAPDLVATRIRSNRPPNLRAIMPVHLYGQCADMDAFTQIAQEFGLLLVEDAAQAIGGRLNSGRAGSLGTAAVFSFYPSKNLNAFGDAGCLTTTDASIADRARMLRNHGSRERYYHEEVGANSRLDSIQAAVLRVKLQHVEHWNEQRRERAAAYDRLLAEAGLHATRSRTSEVSAAHPVKPPFVAPQSYHIFHQYVIRAHKRDELRAFLSERGIGTQIYYPQPLHLQEAFAYLGHREGDFPEAERAAREALALPMFAELTEDEQRYIVETIAEFYS